ncbi:MAG: hypothetical protein JXR70_09745 [Spirochaetales bacterium]|nr:hypothetical protein [Spirochaetales bacterium]
MKIIPFLDKKLNWKSTLLLFLTSAFLAAAILTQFFGLLKLEPKATMDPLFYYSSDTFFNNIDAQGETGRQAYLYLHLLDYLFITRFYLFFALVIRLFLKKLNAPEKLGFLCLLPFVSAIMDILENLSIDISILIFPQKIVLLGAASGIFSCLKMLFLYVWFIIVVVLLVLVIIQAVKKFIPKASS